MQNIDTQWLWLAIGVLILLLLIRALKKPLRFLLRLCIRTALGGATLLLLNTLGAGAGLSLALNPVTAFLCGMLGAPGLGAMLFIKLWI